MTGHEGPETAMNAVSGFFYGHSEMPLTKQQMDAIVWLGVPSSPGMHVTDEMLRQLASQGIIEYDPASGRVRFTTLGQRTYRDIVGSWPKRNVD